MNDCIAGAKVDVPWMPIWMFAGMLANVVGKFCSWVASPVPTICAYPFWLLMTWCRTGNGSDIQSLKMVCRLAPVLAKSACQGSPAAEMVALLENNVTAELKQIMRSNIEELDRISEIINNLLSLSALVHPERMEFSSVDLSELASRVVSKYTQLAKHAQQQVTLRKSPNANVWGNATGLEQIVSNLLKNAIQYTPQGGQVVVTVAPSVGDQVELVIQDSGIGIGRKDLFRIFEPFYRAEQSRNRSQGGSGLGLTIVSELLKLHNGKITIRSAVGRGTSVIILLPAARKSAQVGGSELHGGLNEVAVDFSASRAS